MGLFDGNGNLLDMLRGGLTSALDFGGSLLSSLVDGVNKIMPNMLPTITASLATLQFRGSQGDFSSLSYPIVIRGEFHQIAQQVPAFYGSPLCDYRAIGSMSGFILTKNANLKISGPMQEQTALESLYDAGVRLDDRRYYLTIDDAGNWQQEVR